MGQGGVLKHLDGTNPSIRLASEWTRLLQVSNEDLVLRVQNSEVALLGPEVVASIGQEIPGGDLVGGGIGSTEWITVDGEFDEARSNGSGRVVLELDILGDLNERSDDLTVELGNLGDDTLEGLPKIAASKGEIHNGVSEGHGGEHLTESDVPGIDRGAVSAGVGDCGVGVGSTVPLHGVGDGIANVAFTLLASGLVEENVCIPDNLLGELEERSSPFVDLGLELRVDGGGVDHVDRSTSELDNMALLIEADVESTKVFTPPIGSDNKDLLAIQVLFNCGVGTLSAGEVSEGGVRVTTDDEIQTLGVLGEFLVLFITDMCHCNDARSQLLLPDKVDGFLHSRSDIEELGSRARAGDSGSGLSGDTDNSKVILLENLVGLNEFHEICVVALYVGANSREGQVFQLKPRVELDGVESSW